MDFLVGRSFLAGLAFEGAGVAWAHPLPLVGAEEEGRAGGDVGVIETVLM